MMEFTIPKEEATLLSGFINESLDHLQGIEERVLKLEVSRETELVNSIFRPIHSIKGTSSFFRLDNVTELSHELESLLEHIKKGKIVDIGAQLIDVVLEAVDTLSKMLHNIESAVNTADSSRSPIKLQVAEVAYQDIVNRLKQIDDMEMARQESKNNNSKQEAAGQEAESKTPNDSMILFPGDMKMQYELEAFEQLDHIEYNLLIQEKNPDDAESLNILLRSLHSLKGNTEVLLSVIEDDEIRKTHFLNQVKKAAHLAESIVQRKRDSKQALKAAEIETILNGADFLKHYLEGFKMNETPEKESVSILARLRELAGLSAEDFPEKQPQEVKNAGADSLAVAISNSLEQAFESIDISLMEIADDTLRAAALKKLKRGYKNILKIGMRINHQLLVTGAKNALKLVAFMSHEKTPEETVFIDTLKNELAELMEKGERRRDRREQRRPTMPSPAAERELEARISEKVLKVPQEKIDTFMNLIGELLVGKNTLSAFEREISLEYELPYISDRLKEISDTIARLSNQLQVSIMAIRMLPVYSAFARFPRMIRDLSIKLDKKMRLTISGEKTEVDKNIIEAIADPLVHMVRNCADHGIELPSQRLAKGKSQEGTIQLNASSQGQYVIIEVIDDGKGIDAKKVKDKAALKGLVHPDVLEKMTTAQILELIFLPGFSTAGEVSDVSGRGVGMDVVKTNIEKIGGKIFVESEPDKGSVFTLKLPLTMAIGRGLEVGMQNHRYYIPLSAIIETLRVPGHDIFMYKEQEMIVLRNELIPVYRLHRQLGLEVGEGGLKSKTKKEALVILNVKNRKLGLIVDEYYNESEYVIKPMTGNLAEIDGISGAMISGEGRVNLILDLLKLF